MLHQEATTLMTKSVSKWVSHHRMKTGWVGVSAFKIISMKAIFWVKWVFRMFECQIQIVNNQILFYVIKCWYSLDKYTYFEQLIGSSGGYYLISSEAHLRANLLMSSSRD